MRALLRRTGSAPIGAQTDANTEFVVVDVAVADSRVVMKSRVGAAHGRLIPSSMR